MSTVSTPGTSAVDEFVTKLRNRMDTLRMTPRELAKRAGVGFPYLYRVIKGEQTPSLDWAAKVGSEVGLQIRTITAKSKPQKK